MSGTATHPADAELLEYLFLRKILPIFVDENGCWFSSANPKREKYTAKRINKKKKALHVFAAEMFLNHTDKRLVVCHKCDIPACFNPNHLFIGTIFDNNHDYRCKQKGLIPPIVEPTIFEGTTDFSNVSEWEE